MRGWAGPAPCPLPHAPLAEPWGGGGLAGRVSPGDFEQGRGGSLASKPRVEMADFSGELIRRIILVGESGRFSRQDILAGHFGAFIWRVILEHLFGRFSQ